MECSLIEIVTMGVESGMSLMQQLMDPVRKEIPGLLL
jgi:hypothetical protein